MKETHKLLWSAIVQLHMGLIYSTAYFAVGSSLPTHAQFGESWGSQQEAGYC